MKTAGQLLCGFGVIMVLGNLLVAIALILKAPNLEGDPWMPPVNILLGAGMAWGGYRMVQRSPD